MHFFILRQFCQIVFLSFRARSFVFLNIQNKLCGGLFLGVTPFIDGAETVGERCLYRQRL